jgi:hypothetical protein
MSDFEGSNKESSGGEIWTIHVTFWVLPWFVLFAMPSESKPWGRIGDVLDRNRSDSYDDASQSSEFSVYMKLLIWLKGSCPTYVKISKDILILSYHSHILEHRRSICGAFHNQGNSLFRKKLPSTLGSAMFFWKAALQSLRWLLKEKKRRGDHRAWGYVFVIESKSHRRKSRKRSKLKQNIRRTFPSLGRAFKRRTRKQTYTKDHEL